jgi:photosystem II stability/assembly factor-like uncharacterized protein
MRRGVSLYAVMGCAQSLLLSQAVLAQEPLPYVPVVLRHTFTGAYFTDMNHGYVFGPDSFIATDDGGATWRLVPNIRSTPMFFLDGQTFWFSGPEKGLNRTIDGGATVDFWNHPTFFNRKRDNEETPICGALFFLTAMDGWSICGDSVLRTSDGGHTWAATLLPDVLRHGYDKIHMFDAQRGIAISRNGPVIRTTDGGGTWTAVTNSRVLVRLSCTQTGVCAGLGVGQSPVLVSSDQGETWRDAQIPLQLPDRDRIHVIQAINPTAVVVAGEDVGRNRQDLAPYIGTGTPIPAFGPALGFLLRWNGVTWTRISHPQPRAISSVYFVDSTNGWITGYGDNVIYKTTDGGQTLQFVPDYFRQAAALTPSPTPFVLPTPTSSGS